MRNWLLGHIPTVAAGVMWWVGMVVGAGVIVGLLAICYAGFAEAWHDESAMDAFISFLALGVDALIARWWWGELRRSDEVLTTDG